MEAGGFGECTMAAPCRVRRCRGTIQTASQSSLCHRRILGQASVWDLSFRFPSYAFHPIHPIQGIVLQVKLGIYERGSLQRFYAHITVTFLDFCNLTAVGWLNACRRTPAPFHPSLFVRTMSIDLYSSPTFVLWQSLYLFLQ